MMFFRLLIIAAFCLLVFSRSPVIAFSIDLKGDLANPSRILRNIEREGKAAIAPIVKVIQEGIIETNAPILAGWIISSRNDAQRAGVKPLPTKLIRELAGFVPLRILRRARYRIGGGGDLSLHKHSLRRHCIPVVNLCYGDRRAMALDYVIIFQSKEVTKDIKLWVHELRHIQQFDDWGIHDFAKRYIRNHSAVEREASDFETKYEQWAAKKRPNNILTWDNAHSSAIPTIAFGLH